MAGGRWARGSMVGDGSERAVYVGLVSRGKEIGFYPKYNGRSVESFN